MTLQNRSQKILSLVYLLATELTFGEEKRDGSLIFPYTHISGGIM